MPGKPRHQPSWGRTAGATLAVLVVLVVADALRGIVVATLTAIALGLVYCVRRYVTIRRPRLLRAARREQ